MNQPEKKQRIVSKGQYVEAHGKRIGFGTVGCGLLLVAALCGSVTIGSIGALFAGGGWRAAGEIMASGFLTFYSGYVGFVYLRQSRKIDPGIPLTRKVANTLPAEDSLVRASEEPIQEQQAILLRAAVDGQEMAPDQLVRPIGDPEP